MTIAKMTKWLTRDGWTVEHLGRQYSATKPGCSSRIDFYPNGEDGPEAEAVCLRVAGLDDRDDIQSDYCAGVFCKSLAQAERIAERV